MLSFLLECILLFLLAYFLAFQLLHLAEFILVFQISFKHFNLKGTYLILHLLCTNYQIENIYTYSKACFNLKYIRFLLKFPLFPIYSQKLHFFKKLLTKLSVFVQILYYLSFLILI